MLNETCILVKLTIGMPPQTRTAKKASKDIELKYQTVEKQARVSKNLFSKKDISPLQKVAGQIRVRFNELSLPYDQSYRIIPTNTYFDFIQEMQKITSVFDHLKRKFLDEYHITLMRAEQELGQLFKESDYPAQDSLYDKIFLGIESNVIPPVNAFDSLVGITPDAVEDMKRQAVEGQQEKVDQALKDLFKRLSKSLTKASIRLSNKDSNFKDSIIGNIEAALDAVETLNLTENEELIAMADEVKAVISDISPAALRQDEELRQSVAEETEVLVNKISEFF